VQKIFYSTVWFKITAYNTITTQNPKLISGAPVEQNIAPTLRTMFYRLVSLQVIPNTNQAYKSLSRETVKARKSGIIPWDAFSDEGRLVLGDLD
jgi:hypothetical protein